MDASTLSKLESVNIDAPHFAALATTVDDRLYSHSQFLVATGQVRRERERTESPVCSALQIAEDDTWLESEAN